MARFWTSDLHLGHANIIRYCSRPFADVDAMNRALIDGWNEVVTAADEVWVLGDVALGPIADTLALVAGLNGRKILVAGNHDRCWAGHGAKAEPWIARYEEAGFDTVLQGTVDATLGSRQVHCSHFPYRGDSHDPGRYLHHRPADDGAVLLHGHVHGRWRVNDRQVNVGVDAWGFRPITDEQVIEAIGVG